MKKLVSLATVVAIGLSGAAMAQQVMTEPQVESTLTEQGYTNIHDLKFRDGMWRAHAKSADGNRLEVRVDATSGRVYPDEQVSRMSADDIRAALTSQGYTHVHDVDYDDGLWNAKARDPAGGRVELRVDPTTGQIVGAD